MYCINTHTHTHARARAKIFFFVLVVFLKWAASIKNNIPGRKKYLFLISNFRYVLNVVCFLLGNSSASEFYIPTFRNTLSVPSSMEQREYSENSAYKIQTPGNCPEESIQQEIFK
jgi:hypothetical protein